jgi:hypothetical protein
MTRQSGYSTGSSCPFTDRPTAQVGPFGAPKATCGMSSAENQHKYSRAPKPQEPEKSPVTELVWPAKAKSSVRSHLHSTQRRKLSSD